jgi:hypothetical protein
MKKGRPDEHFVEARQDFAAARARVGAERTEHGSGAIVGAKQLTRPEPDV